MNRILVILDRYPIDDETSGAPWLRESLLTLGNFAEVDVISIVNLLPRVRNLMSNGKERQWLRAARSLRNQERLSERVSVKHLKVLVPPAKISWRLHPWLLSKEIIPRIRRIIEGKTYDAIVSHFTFPAGQTAARLSEILQVPLVCVNHDGMGAYARYLPPAAMREVKSVLGRADTIVALSENHQAELAREFPRKRIHRIPLGCLPSSSPRVFNQADAFRVVTASRLDDALKKVELLLEAFRVFLRTVTSNATLTVAGDGYRLKHLKQLASRLNIADKVSFLGWVANSSLKEIFSRNHVFVQASEYETFGYAALEAVAVGLPAMGVIDTGFLGEILPMHAPHLSLMRLDAQEISSKLAESYLQREQLQNLGRSLQHVVQEEYSWDVHAAAWEMVLNQYLRIRG